jgi:hypothetical protein
MIELDPGTLSGVTTLGASVVLGLTARAGLRRFDQWIDERRRQREQAMPIRSVSAVRR